MAVALVGIVKNEGKFVAEWLAHYVNLGFDKIIVYNNDSIDDTAQICRRAAKIFPIEVIDWPSVSGQSPQVTAYNHAKGLLADFEWVAYFDCDEFLVLHQDNNIKEFLERYQPDVGAIGINWVTFGSSGLLVANYGLVTETFFLGGSRTWGNNRHIKTIARVSMMESMGIHDCLLSAGHYVHPNGEVLTMPTKRGISEAAEHSIAQLNHYQVKSKEDFDEKMRKGRAGKKDTSAGKIRANPEEFFQAVDRNDFEYHDIDRFLPGLKARLAEILKVE